MNAVAIAAELEVDPTQVRRWIRRGYDPSNLDSLFISLGRQRRPGRIFLKLADDEVRAKLQNRINEHTAENHTQSHA